MLNVVLFGIFTLLGILLLIIIFPIRVRLNGNLIIQESFINGGLQFSFGYKNRGVKISIFPNRFITFGKYEKPLFSKTLDEKPIKSIFLKDGGFSLKKTPFTKLTKSILKTFHWEETSITGRLGLSNPMHTGIIIGYIHAINGIVKPRKFRCSLEPTFSPTNNTDIEGNFQIRFSPIFTTIKAGLAFLKFRK